MSVKETLRPLSLAVLFAACGSTAPMMQRENLANVYARGPNSIRLEARIHHVGPEVSTLYFKVSTADLLYKGDGSGGPYKARVRLTYGTFANWDSRQLLDSASTIVQDKSSTPTEERELIGSINLRRRTGTEFVVKVIARDLNRDNESAVMLRVKDGDVGSEQHFLPIDPASSLPLFSDHLPLAPRIVIRNEALARQSVLVSRFATDPGNPLPVFSAENRTRSDPPADSTFRLMADDAGRFELLDAQPGAYRFSRDSLADGAGPGYTLHLLDRAFPLVDHGEDLVRPLRYITSLQEYERISKAAAPRQAVERFWIDAAGDRERAREAIRIYYGRVENANRHFSALTEGWRTDRGLVHIIFGTPTTIYRSEKGESWTYGEENNIMSLTFHFVRRKSALTDNDLWLERDPSLKGAWYRNVESWRNGRVYQN